MPAITVLTALALCAVVAGAALTVMRRRMLLVTVVGHSMEPTLSAGARVVVWRTRRLSRGDLVVFTPPTASADPDDPRLRIKRVMAITGDETPAWAGGEGHGRLPRGQLVVRGDATISEDSRSWGPISERLVVGRVVRAR
jgi:signal peptidase I